MPRLNDLPTELLLLVLTHVPQSTKIALWNSCRRFKELLTPRIYSAVFFWKEGFAPKTHHHFHWSWPNRQVNPPLHATRIFDINSFTRTIESSEYIRTLVKHVDIRWFDKPVFWETDVKTCLESLRLSSLITLHISPPDFYFEIPSQLPLTSLAFQYDDSTYSDDCDLERLYALFQISTLTHFRLDGKNWWGLRSGEHPIVVPSEKVQTSNVTHLTLNCTGSPGEELQQVLSWPRALKAFDFDSWQYDGSRYASGQDPSTLELQHAIDHQRRSLENLKLCGNNGGSKINKVYEYASNADWMIDPELGNSIFLLESPFLKHLHIKAEFLILTSDMDHWGTPSTHEIGDTLPPTLEELILDTDEALEHPVEWDDEDAKNYVVHLHNWLVNIAAAKTAKFPYLRRVAFDSRHYSLKDSNPRAQELKCMYDELDIELKSYDFNQQDWDQWIGINGLKST